MGNLPAPPKESIIYEDENLYICLSSQPLAEGHIIVVWKKEVADLNLLPDRDYDYLMDTVFAARNALLKTLGLKKVYLVYMDEANHVHWHLIPRYKEEGFDVFDNKPGEVKDFSLTEKIKENLVFE